jgi:hypothetical protein
MVMIYAVTVVNGRLISVAKVVDERQGPQGLIVSVVGDGWFKGIR